MIHIPKIAAEDTTLTVGNANGENLTVPVPKGIRISISTPALHYNREHHDDCWEMPGLNSFFVARYWKDPYSFRPARFLEDWPRDAFLPFSSGEYLQRCL